MYVGHYILENHSGPRRELHAIVRGQPNLQETELRDYFVSPFTLDTTAEQIKGLLEHHGIRQSTVHEFTSFSSLWTSFKVTVPQDQHIVIINPSIWHGAVIQDYIL